MVQKVQTIAQVRTQLNLNRRNRWQFYCATNGWHWRCLDKNGRILFVASEGYTKKAAAIRCARRAGWSEDVHTTGLD